MHRNIDNLRQTIHKYLERNSLFVDNPPWEIRKSDLGGFGIFAKRSIETGELIFKDHPVILGPRAGLSCPSICVNCYNKDNLNLCEKNCGLPVCSKKCQDSTQHRRECKIIRQWQTRPISGELSTKLAKVLSPIRSLFLSDEDRNVVRFLKAHKSDQHGFEVDVMKKLLCLNVKEDEENFMRLVCSVMDANAFEVLVGNEDNQSSVRGLYPLGSLANHSCTPNTIHVFDKQQRMVVRASKFIPEGTEIFHSYSRCIWGTPTRRFHLFRTKHFLCKCPRCEDPTEFGAYVSAVLCKVCKTGKVIPIKPLVQNGKWQCENCGETLDKKDVASISSLLGSTLSCFSGADDLTIMAKFIEKKAPILIPENNETIVELKYKLIWMLGHEAGYFWSELSDDLLNIKEKYCKDLLNLLEILLLGQCKMRGLLLFELCCCHNELKRRQIKFGSGCKIYDNKDLLVEAADILMYDVSAPTEIKRLWPEELQNE